jgi:hypothetical protein
VLPEDSKERSDLAAVQIPAGQARPAGNRIVTAMATS